MRVGLAQLHRAGLGQFAAAKRYQARNQHLHFPGKVQTLLQHEPTIEAIKAGKSPGAIKQTWLAGLEEFKKRREQFLLYK